MKKLIKQLHWALKRKNIETGLMEYCKLEYSNGEVQYAFNRVLANHKDAFINGGNL